MKNIIRELRFPSISPDTHGDIVDVIYHENSNARGDMALIDDRVKSLVLQNPRYKQCTTVHLTPLFSKRQYRTLNHHGYTMRADCYYRGYYIGSVLRDHVSPPQGLAPPPLLQRKSGLNSLPTAHPSDREQVTAYAERSSVSKRSGSTSC